MIIGPREYVIARVADPGLGGTEPARNIDPDFSNHLGHPVQRNSGTREHVAYVNFGLSVRRPAEL